ncbi:hypothetical protein FJ366_02045 [Candidatus Dependentiae bacterium]|nr:hypothetical protein [Candidatus Dependentiae bacterium]
MRFLVLGMLLSGFFCYSNPFRSVVLKKGLFPLLYAGSSRSFCTVSSSWLSQIPLVRTLPLGSLKKVFSERRATGVGSMPMVWGNERVSIFFDGVLKKTFSSDEFVACDAGCFVSKSSGVKIQPILTSEITSVVAQNDDSRLFRVFVAGSQDDALLFHEELSVANTAADRDFFVFKKTSGSYCVIQGCASEVKECLFASSAFEEVVATIKNKLSEK